MENELFNYSPIIERPKIKWPNGEGFAVYIGLNIEDYELGKPATSIFSGTANLDPDPLNYGWRDYGVRVGLWRIMDLLDKYKMRASVLLNSDVCAHYPQIIKADNERNWAWIEKRARNKIIRWCILNSTSSFLLGYFKTLTQSQSFKFGMGRIELPLYAPKAYVLPLYHIPRFAEGENRTLDTRIFLCVN